MQDQRTERRFQINPGNLRVFHGVRQQEDSNASRCQADLKSGAGRCLNDATWSVLTSEGELQLCGLHVLAARDWQITAAVERLS